MMSEYIVRVQVQYGYLELLKFRIPYGLDTLTKFIEKLYTCKNTTCKKEALIYNYDGHNIHNIYLISVWISTKSLLKELK